MALLGLNGLKRALGIKVHSAVGDDDTLDIDLGIVFAGRRRAQQLVLLTMSASEASP